MRLLGVLVVVAVLAGCGGDDATSNGRSTACREFTAGADSVVFFVPGTDPEVVDLFGRRSDFGPGVSTEVLTEEQARDRFGAVLSEEATAELGAVVLEDWADLQDLERLDRSGFEDGEATIVDFRSDDPLSLGLVADGIEVVIFFQPDAPRLEIEMLHDSILARDDVHEVVYLDQDDAHAEFSELFADSPDFVESILPSELPSSIRIVPRSDRVADVAEMGADYAGGPWARQVMHPDPSTYLWFDAPSLAEELHGCGPLHPLDNAGE